MDKRFLIVCGCVTDQCVSHAIKDAADLGYLVTMVTDCCVTYTEDRHLAAIEMVKGYCRQRTLEGLMEELRGHAGKKRSRRAGDSQAGATQSGEGGGGGSGMQGGRGGGWEFEAGGTHLGDLGKAWKTAGRGFGEKERAGLL